MHPTSLPSRFGIGDFGQEAYHFVDFLAAAGQRIWQVLPLGPTGYGDSPYQLFSAFAGNPLLISLERLADEGLLSPADLDPAPDFPVTQVDYGRVIQFKMPLLRRAYERFRQSPGMRQAFEAFRKQNAAWLDDYGRFMSRKLAEEIESLEFTQFLFFRQWGELHDYARQRGIQIMGDLPIYVAHDSADVWAHADLFQLDESGNPTVLSGVPPDYFSATGQLWGNPIYRWDRMAATGFRWWIERLRATLALVDIVRIDHFRGLEAYWEVPAGKKTAEKGRWVKGCGAALFEALRGALGDLPIVAENLGVITPEVEALRTQFGFPGMAILQFAFGKDPQAPTFRPHNYPRDLVAYTGTHDNDTVLGWWTSEGAGDSTRTSEDVREEHDLARKYLATDGGEMNWVFIRTLLASVADTVLFPLQDVLGLGSEARMNIPAVPSGNWRWRYTAEMLMPEIAARLKDLVITYDR